MINIEGLNFYENEEIKMDGIYRCHPQLTKEIYGIPLRACVGYHVNYNKETMKYQSTTFYVPMNKKGVLPYNNLKYVLACNDGELKMIKDNLALIQNGYTIIYSNMRIIKTSGTVKKGQIIGEVGDIKDNIGFGVTLTIYNQNGDIIELSNCINNIKSIE